MCCYPPPHRPCRQAAPVHVFDSRRSMVARKTGGVPDGIRSRCPARPTLAPPRGTMHGAFVSSPLYLHVETSHQQQRPSFLVFCFFGSFHKTKGQTCVDTALADCFEWAPLTKHRSGCIAWAHGWCVALRCPARPVRRAACAVGVDAVRALIGRSGILLKGHAQGFPPHYPIFVVPVGNRGGNGGGGGWLDTEHGVAVRSALFSNFLVDPARVKPRAYAGHRL